MPPWTTVRVSCGSTSKCCLRSPCSAGWAPADSRWPSALMTYRLERCGIHVSRQCHGPTAKTVGEGRERADSFSPSSQTEDWPLDFVTSRFPPTDHKWRMWRAKNGEEGCWRGTLQLKRLSSYKLKRHYLLTWRCTVWGCKLWCENTARQTWKRRKKRIKERRVDCYNW